MDKLTDYVDTNLDSLIIVTAVIWLLVAAWVMLKSRSTEE